MKAGRATKIFLSFLIVGAHLFFLFAALAVILSVIGAWIVWAFLLIILGLICFGVFKLINWIWKGDIETSDNYENNIHNGDNTLRRIFLTILILESFLLFFFLSWVVIQSFIGFGVLLISVIIMIYGFYRSIKWVWKT